MNYGILLCVLCLIIIGTASAATNNPAIVRQQTNVQLAVAAAAHTTAITFNSSVQGATVWLDGALVGSDEAHSKTPVTDNLVTAGEHTATFRLSGYKDYVSSFTVVAGKPQTIYAQLQPAIARAVASSDIVQTAGGIQEVRQVSSSALVTQGNAIDSFIQTIFNVFQPGSGSATKSGLQVQHSVADVAAISNLPFINPTAPIVDQFGTVFIGEQGLDVTHALNQAYDQQNYAYDRTPSVTTIGWWASDADVYVTTPVKQLDLNGRYKDLYIDPAEFVGYTGTWYIMNPKNHFSDHEADVYRGQAFFVKDPDINIGKTRSMTRGPVSGRSVTRGDKIGFIIDSRMPDAVAPDNYRSSLSSSPYHGFMDIIIQDPSGKLLTSINTVNIQRGNDGITVSNQVTHLQEQCEEPDDLNGVRTVVFQSSCTPEWWWDTGAVDAQGILVYPKGTYTAWAVSRLNNMDNNYKNGGQPYTGKTVSEKITFTLE